MIQLYRHTMILNAQGFRQYAPSLWHAAVPWSGTWQFHRALGYLTREGANDHQISQEMLAGLREHRRETLYGVITYFQRLLGVRNWYPDMRGV